MTLDEWMKSPAATGKTCAQWLAELVAKNDGEIEITAFGGVKPGGPYGHTGLTAEEAISLAYTSGMAVGICLACDADAMSQIAQYVIDEVKKQMARYYDPNPNPAFMRELWK